jgi:hypothetical protein
MENVGGRSVLGGQRGGVPVTREKQAVHAGFGLKPDRLTGGEIRPSKPSQTFSPNPARTDLDEGAFADLTGRNGTRSPFSQVKSAIEHKRRYAHLKNPFDSPVLGCNNRHCYCGGLGYDR